MSKKQPLLSICIPTFKREYLIEKLLDGVYAQNCDNELFDICITDNSETDETKNLIESRFADKNNLHYKKVQCEGFMNSIEALKLGDGLFLKLQNDYSLFTDGGLKRLLERVDKSKEEKPVLFFPLRGRNKDKIFYYFDDFMCHINYLATWSSSFGIWKEDFDRLRMSHIECNYMYPHTSLLFALNYKDTYTIDDFAYYVNEVPKRKYAYNFNDNFVRLFLGMVKEDLLAKALISDKTYKRIKCNILRFCARIYVEYKKKKNSYYSFDKRYQIIEEECNYSGVIIYAIFVVLYGLKSLLANTIWKDKAETDYYDNKTKQET